MTHYTWEEVSKMTTAQRLEHFNKADEHDFYGPTDAKTLEFTKDGIEQLQHDVITFLDQFDEMPQQLVDEICQTIINYYIKHRDSAPLDK